MPANPSAGCPEPGLSGSADAHITPLSRFAAFTDLLLAVGVVLVSIHWASRSNSPFRHMRGVPAVLVLAAFQFAAEGLVPLLLMAIHRERFSGYGFKLRNAAKSIVLAMVLAALYDLGLSWQAGAWLWVPLYRHTAIRLSLAAGLPLGLLGLAVTIAVWGWLEGFFGVFFARRVDQALGHDGTGWFASGAVAFGLFNGALHLAIGQGMVGFLTSFASGYVIGVIPAVTRNAWGSTVFQSLTNSIGRL